MFTRIVSLVLIAAVVVCPLSCDAGLCHVDHRCAINDDDVSGEQCRHSTSTACPLQSTHQSCCPKSADDEPNRDDRGGPCPGPCRGKTICQGVCGGAVFEKPCEPDHSDASFFLPSSENDCTFIVALLTNCKIDRVGFRECDDHQNRGRFVRILHLSFLC